MFTSLKKKAVYPLYPFYRKKGKQLGHYREWQLVFHNPPYKVSSRDKVAVSHSQTGTWGNLKRKMAKEEPGKNKN